MLTLLGFFPGKAIINMIILSLGAWGPWTVDLAWALWWLDALLSVGSLFLMFPIFQSHHLDLKSVNATLLFPFVPCVVAAATGGLVASALPDAERAQVTLLVSYVLWGIGEAFTVVVLGMYFQRLCLHSLPPRTAIVSVFLPSGRSAKAASRSSSWATSLLISSPRPGRSARLRSSSTRLGSGRSSMQTASSSPSSCGAPASCG